MTVFAATFIKLVLTQHNCCRQTAKTRLENNLNKNISMSFWSNIYIYLLHLWLFSRIQLQTSGLVFNNNKGLQSKDTNPELATFATTLCTALLSFKLIVIPIPMIFCRCVIFCCTYMHSYTTHRHNTEQQQTSIYTHILSFSYTIIKRMCIYIIH